MHACSNKIILKKDVIFRAKSVGHLEPSSTVAKNMISVSLDYQCVKVKQFV